MPGCGVQFQWTSGIPTLPTEDPAQAAALAMDKCLQEAQTQCTDPTCIFIKAVKPGWITLETDFRAVPITMDVSYHGWFECFKTRAEVGTASHFSSGCNVNFTVQVSQLGGRRPLNVRSAQAEADMIATTVCERMPNCRSLKIITPVALKPGTSSWEGTFQCVTSPPSVPKTGGSSTHENHSKD